VFRKHLVILLHSGLIMLTRKPSNRYTCTWQCCKNTAGLLCKKVIRSAGVTIAQAYPVICKVTAMGVRRHGQGGHLPLPWKCCKVLFASCAANVVWSLSKQSIYALFL